MPEKPRTWMLVAALGVVVVLIIVLLGGDGEGDGNRSGGSVGPDPVVRVPAPRAWPEALTEADRARLEPILRRLEGSPGDVGRALEELRSPGLITDLAPRARDVLLVLRPMLEELLQTTEDPIRRATAHLVSAWLEAIPEADREAIATLVPLASLSLACAASDDVQLRREVVVLFGSIPGRDAIVRLRSHAEDADPSVRREVLRALAARPGGSQGTFLRTRFFAEREPGVRAEILRLLRREPALRDHPGLPELARGATQDEAAAVRVAAIELLGEVGGRESFGILKRTLEHEDRDTRLASILALGRFGGAGAGRLLEALEDPGDADPEYSGRLEWARRRCRE